MKTNDKICYLISLLPIIDLITSIQTRFYPDAFSIGMIIKGIIFLLSTFYVVFKSTSKYKKTSVIYYICLFIYILGYFGFKMELLNINYFITEVTYLFKLLYLPVVFLGLLNYFDEYKVDKKCLIRSLIITLVEYVILILLPILMDSSFLSYGYGLSGTVGWFYAANEISVILIMLFPFVFYSIKSKKIYTLLFSIPVLFIISSIGTKVTLAGTLIIAILSFIIVFISQKFKFNKYTYKTIFIVLISIIMLFGLKDIAIENLRQIYKDKGYDFVEIQKPNNEEDTNTNITTTKKRITKTVTKRITKTVTKRITKTVTKKKTSTIKRVELPVTNELTVFSQMMKFLLSARDSYYYNTKEIYVDTYSIDYTLFGMGFSDTSKINDSRISKLIEIDFLDMYYHTGLISLFLNLFPVIYMVIKVIKYLFNKKISRINYCYIIYNTLIVFLVLGISSLAGHVLMAPSVSIYLCLYIILIFYYIEEFYNKKINDNKIAILALHLNHGGVENVLTNQANMLIDNYDVEIISLYKSGKKIPFDINSNIKITYLMKTISNREDFKNAIDNRCFKNIVKEGFKALKILYLKPLLIKKAILNSDAKIIISTRKEFSKILGKYHRNNVITISEEHNYHNNNKDYINDVIKYNKKIDYLLPVSKELCDFYENIVKPQVYYISNALNYLPKALNNLNTKKIVAIGRLSEEKGFMDIVDVMKEICEKDKEIVLDIYGDGIEREKISNKIKKAKLENNIILKGFVTSTVLHEELKNYSLILSTSHTESFGLGVLEAMSHGIPAIIFDSAKGILEFVNDDNGIIIKNRNKKEMANDVIKLLNNKAELIKLSKNSAKKSSEYSFNNIKTTLNNFIKEILLKENYQNYLEKIYDDSKKNYFKILKEDLKNNNKKFIITANPETLTMSNTDKEILKMLLDENNSVIPDGIAIVKACKILNIKVTERIAGVDVAEYLLDECNNQKKSLYLFGAQPEVIESLISKIKKDYKNIKILGYSDGYVKDRDKVFEEIVNLEPDVCLVALGIPHQEKIIYKYLDKFKKGIFVGVGGSFDVISGSKKRAPKIFIKLNLEWLYRIACEPKRLKRFWDNNIKFILKIYNEKQKNR